MNIDCQWIEKNLESLFCGRLGTGEDRLAREHIEACERCRQEVVDLNAIDPLVKKYFHYELAQAVKPRPEPGLAGVRIGRVFGLGTVAAAAVAILMAAVLRAPQTSPIAVPSEPAQVQIVPPVAVEPPAVIKGGTAIIPERAKPSSEGQKAASSVQTDQAKASSLRPAVDSNSPDFVVSDPAGYSRTLEDYRGHILLIGVWASAQPASIANLERLYKTFGSNAKLRLVAVSNERQSRPLNTTFPVFYNQGSRLLGAKPGEFILLDETGTLRLRGSLVKDFEQLRSQLQ